MTVRELIEKLQTFHPDALVYAWDPEAEEMVEVTGTLYIPTLPYRVEMQTDEP